MNQMRHLSVKLNDGHFMPALGFGTSAPDKVPKERVEEAVQRAIEVGYRHIDSAYLYTNEEEVGRAIQKKISDGTVKRQDVFYTSKLWPTFYRPEMVRGALETSLRKAQLSYVDLYLMHFPGALKVVEGIRLGCLGRVLPHEEPTDVPEMRIWRLSP
ncbi:putative aldo-keto reductase family 1 member C8 [Suncus etruscus]|uniref:putative aldo-keto reductase family 1 member C8 n=1 Tax=Suncus etruscus TaxID=109475 RepID=UPI00210F9415|nr:putative aldo-keto reductase family 1 member C8 [Suncus etruscus]